VALECNFRQNGFAYALDFARRYFEAEAKELHIRYREGMTCGHAGTAALLRRLRKIKVQGEPLLLDRPGMRSGAALMTPPLKGKCSIALFSRQSGYVKAATAALAEAGL
jgi:hypothetical protein